MSQRSIKKGLASWHIRVGTTLTKKIKWFKYKITTQLLSNKDRASLMNHPRRRTKIRN